MIVTLVTGILLLDVNAGGSHGPQIGGRQGGTFILVCLLAGCTAAPEDRGVARLESPKSGLVALEKLPAEVRASLDKAANERQLDSVDLNNPIVDYFDGYDTFAGEIRSTACAEGQKPKPGDIPNSGHTNYAGYVVETAQQIAKSTQMSLSASFGYGIYSGSASYEAISSESASGRSLYATIRASYVTDPVSAHPTGLTSTAHRLLHTDLVKFLETCGDSYVLGASYGAAYEGELSVVANDQSEQDTERATLQAGLNGLIASGHIDASIQTSMSKLLSTKTQSFDHRYIGDDPSVANTTKYCPPNSLVTLPGTDLAQILQFGSTIYCRGKAGHHIMKWYVHGYRELDPSAPALDSLSIDPTVQAIMRVYTRRASLQYALEHADQFGPFDHDNAKLEIAKLTTMLNSLGEQFKAAARSGDQNKAGDFQKSVESAASVRDPLHFARLYQPMITSAGEHTIDHFSDDYPVALYQTGPVDLSHQDPRFTCPTHCVGPSSLVFRNDNAQVVGGVSPLAINQIVRVPANSWAYFVMLDSDQDPGYTDNEWYQGSGIRAFELVDKP